MMREIQQAPAFVMPDMRGAWGDIRAHVEAGIEHLQARRRDGVEVDHSQHHYGVRAGPRGHGGRRGNHCR